MTADAFRKMALDYPNAVESAHMNHPDFRIDGKIFATLGVPDKDWGMVKLTPEQQQSFMREAPEVFHPCSGAWGRGGSTNVHLTAATKKLVRAAMDCAFQNVIAKKRKSPR
jgi:YjbR